MSFEALSLIFGIAVFFVVFIVFSIGGSADPTIARRLHDTKTKAFESVRSHDDDLFKNIELKSQQQRANLIELLKESTEYRLYFAEKVLKNFKFTSKVKKMFKMADVKIPIDLFFMMIIGLFLMFFILAILIKQPILIFMGLVAAYMPFVALKMKRAKRAKQFSVYFPFALGIIANALRAGHAMHSTFQMVSVESPYPVNKIFKTLSDDIALGRDVRESLEDLLEVMPESQDLKFFITAVLIQKEIGGNLADILDTLNNTIRERVKLMGLIRTQTAQAKFSGVLLGLAPVVITILISFINPVYMKPLFEEALGKMLLVGAGGISFMGFFIIQKITNIRV